MKIIITEQQFHKLVENNLLKEYMDSSFDWDEFNYRLDNLGITAAEEYCWKNLGKPIGEGSSRIVFEIDDHTVLKLSLSKDEIEQNLHEYNVYNELKDNPLLPRIYGHSDDYVWLWSEKVIPCTHEDFERILGIPYNLKGVRKEDLDSIGFDEYGKPNDIKYEITDDDGEDNKLDFLTFITWWNDYKNEWEDLWDETERTTFREWLKHPWFQNLIELLDYQNSDEFFDDNFGIAIRNEKPTIVILDIGFFN